MKREALYYIVESFFQLSSIPCRIYHDKQLLKTFSPFSDSILLTQYDSKLFGSSAPTDFLLTPEFLALGRITCKSTCDSVILGPVKTALITNGMFQDFLISNDLPLSDADKLLNQLDKLRSVGLEYYAGTLAAFYCSINHEPIDSSVFLSQIPLRRGEEETDLHLLSEQEAIVFGDNIPHNTYTYEQKMLHCVKNGLIEELNSMGGLDSDMRMNTFTHDSLRYYKNIIHTQDTLISRAAIEGGLDPETAFSMSDLFVQQIENCETLNELIQISSAIRNDFCKRVRDIKYPQINDVIVNKAIQYINAHVHENISAQQIADHLNISREYLSRKFKKETGHSIPDYINEQKVIVAKKLLKFSDKPLVMISNYLSYSSQSYFQTQFKRVTGVTPTEYRQSIRKNT